MIRSSSYTKEGILKQPDRATESDHDDDNDVYNDVDVDEMDCRRDEYRRSMQSSSSLSHLVDSLIVHVPPEMDANDKTTMTSLSTTTKTTFSAVTCLSVDDFLTMTMMPLHMTTTTIDVAATLTKRRFVTATTGLTTTTMMTKKKAEGKRLKDNFQNIGIR